MTTLLCSTFTKDDFYPIDCLYNFCRIRGGNDNKATTKVSASGTLPSENPEPEPGAPPPSESSPGTAAESAPSCPRLALSSMLDSMRVIGPKGEKNGDKGHKKDDDDEDDSDTDGDDDSDDGKKKKKKKDKKQRKPKKVMSEEASF